ncbi:carboxylesterase/lipase family protein [uncultured Mycolicibacterium sp.]|uniref:carboxylesterase/lipase family protein n=1 Tax=uncultured Mycolicibacterium sp. TaxID=2320817 RepID=UPI00263178D6|nr:carboxylesterase/lipase family protein [uncultured Mycolicibacterium sp.]
MIVEARTTYGPVRGTDDGTVKVWRGIRYAAPPVGELRWRAPRPPQPWREPADATRVGPACPQPVDPRLPIDLGAPQGDDCLRLNVWASSDTRPGAGKPVLVWVHGGAYVIGAASQSLYRGRELARSGEVVVVTLNYRLGAFGFLELTALSSGRRPFDTNVGLRDVIFALQWVRDNIAEFGGDPDRVTLFGESAGGGIVTTLLASPAAEGLFQRAIAQSSPATSVYSTERAVRVAEQFLGHLGLGRDDVDRLPELPVSAIVAASKHVFDDVPKRTPGTLAFAPIVDGDIVPDYPVKLAREGRTHPVPLIIGTNKHEASLFRFMRSPLMPVTPEAVRTMFANIAAERPDLPLPSEAEIEAAYRRRRRIHGLGVARDIGFRMPSVWFAEGHLRVAPVYLYRFDWFTPLLRLLGLGAAHATELPYVWGNLVMGPRDPTFKLGGLRTGREVSRRMRTRWINFAVRGEPAGPAGTPSWPPYDTDARPCLLIGAEDRVVDDVDAHIRPVWGDDVLSFR